MYSVACSMLLKNVGCDPLNVSCTPLMDCDQFKKHLSKAFWTEGEAYEVTYYGEIIGKGCWTCIWEDPEGTLETVT